MSEIAVPQVGFLVMAPSPTALSGPTELEREGWCCLPPVASRLSLSLEMPSPLPECPLPHFLPGERGEGLGISTSSSLVGLPVWVPWCGCVTFSTLWSANPVIMYPFASSILLLGWHLSPVPFVPLSVCPPPPLTGVAGEGLGLSDHPLGSSADMS